MKILLAGDSWGCGTWVNTLPNEPYGVVHKGIEQFMIDDGIEVLNISEGGLSNSEIIRKLVCVRKIHTYDYIFFIQSDPLRDLKNSIGVEDKIKWFEDYEHLLKIRDQQLTKTYVKLNQFSNQIGVKIHMLAGCSKIDKKLIEPYNNLICVIPAIIEFLCPNSSPDIWIQGNWHKFIDDKWSLETIDKLIEQHDILLENQKKCIYFKNDWAHPSAEGYRKVYEFIKQHILT